MKILILLFLFINLTVSLKSQDDSVETKLNTFMKIPFGETYQSVKKMKTNFESDDSYPLLDCNDCNFGKFNGHIMLKFNTAKQFYMGYVSLTPKEKNLIFELYDDVISEITKKYGKSQFNKETFKYPFESEGRKYATISVPTSDVSSFWVFKSENNDGNSCIILVRIRDDFKVSLTYLNQTLYESDSKKNEKKQNQDY
jgi:hypothetical protein